MKIAYPLMLDVTDRLIVIIGGGAVAARKARGLFDAGATRVRLVAPAFHNDVPANAEKITATFSPEYLDGASLVFAATDSAEVNDTVVQEARRRNVWVSRADSADDEPGDFTVPAIHRDGPVTVAISAGAPALAATIRDNLAQKFDPRWRQMAEAMRTIRPKLIETLSPELRRKVFSELAGEAALAILASGDVESLLRWLSNRYPDLKMKP